MIDQTLGDLKFPPKWRSSLTVYHYVVPEEDTADAYPNSRIVYLRLTASITGWNPNEELRNSNWEPGETILPDALQKLGWGVVIAEGWASKYYPCHGAIMQIGIYPPKRVPTILDNYPEIMDFEPKKREMFDSITEGQELLAGSSEKSFASGSTTRLDSQEVGFSIAGYSIDLPFTNHTNVYNQGLSLIHI